MTPIKQTELHGHLEKLRAIFNQRLEIKHGDMHRVNHGLPWLSPEIYVSLSKNSCTVEVASDRGQNEVCGVLSTKRNKRVLCSFFETWKKGSGQRMQFDNLALTFFLEFDEAGVTTTKQMFRLEWENWHTEARPSAAAHPHWQFDRWLTGSDEYQLDQLRRRFAITEDVETVFVSAEEQVNADQRGGPCRPDLGWFTRIHFAAIAPWATRPIVNVDDPRELFSHRSVPNSTLELERWTDSALCYLKSELDRYG